MMYKKTYSSLLMLFVCTVSRCAPDIPVMTDEEKGRYNQHYKAAIYDEKEVAHYLGRVNAYFLVDPMKDGDIANVIKLYNEKPSLIADITSYYQNQLVRSELFWKSRKEKVMLSQIESIANTVMTRINMLVEKYTDVIAAFERANQYDFGGKTGANPATWGPDHPVGNNLRTWNQLEIDTTKEAERVKNARRTHGPSNARARGPK